MDRMSLNSLLLEGKDKKVARIDFSMGLNVISGPSDTGKTYIFQCLEYCLGAETIPKSIKEAEGYTKLKLSFSIGKKEFTICRDLYAGNVEFYEVGVDNINDNIIPQKFFYTKLSEVLMNKLGVENIKLLKNSKGDTVNLTIAKFRRLSFVDETEMQSENSPFVSGQYTKETQEKAFINHVLTGIDYNDIIKNEDKKVVQARIQAKIELLEELIGKNIEQPNEYEFKGILEQIEKLKEAIITANNKFLDINKLIKDLETSRENKYNEIVKIKSLIAYKEETLKRFELLYRRYTIDMERLDAILQSSNLFLSSENQLIVCPLCGTEKENKDEKISPQYINSIKESCEKEILKIAGLKSELKITIDTIYSEINSQKNILWRLNKELDDIKDNLSLIVKRELVKVKDELYQLYSKKSSLEEKSIRYNQLKEFLDLKEINKELLRTKQTKQGYDAKIKTATMSELCQYTYNTLKMWDFPELRSVSFSESCNDIVIGDKDRNAFGKGYRAIIRSALNISLMKYCLDKKLPHLGFVVLDSPVLTFRGADKKSVNGDSISDELKNNFFTNLAEINKNTQIIIIENKEPPASIIDKVQYIHFTKTKEHGRYGFIPID